MSNRVKFNSYFKFDTFSSFFSNNTKASCGVTLRPIDIKVLNYLSFFEEDILLKVVNDISEIFEFFQLDCEIKDSVTFDIVKLSLKKKNYKNSISFLSEEKRNKATLLIDNLNLNLFNLKSKPGVVCAFFEFLYSIRTNRLTVKRYTKYRDLFLEVQGKNFFKVLKAIFSKEIRYYSNNCYDTFESKFLKKDKIIINNDSSIIGFNKLNDNKCIFSLTKKSIDEFSYLTSLLMKINQDFVDFANKKTEFFYLGSFCLILKKIIKCLSNIQYLLFEKITFKMCCELLKSLNTDKILSDSESANIFKYIDCFYKGHKISDQKNFGTSSSSYLTTKMIHLNNYIDILDSDKSTISLIDYDMNLKLKPITLKNFYKKIKLKKNKNMLADAYCYGSLPGKGLECFGISWATLQNKLIKEKCDDLLCILTFFRNIETLLSKIFQNFMEKHKNTCYLIIEDGKNIMNKSKKSKKGSTDIVEGSKV